MLHLIKKIKDYRGKVRNKAKLFKGIQPENLDELFYAFFLLKIGKYTNDNPPQIIIINV